MAWEDIWYDGTTRRLRTAWRVLLFWGVALFLTMLFISLLAFCAAILGAKVEEKNIPLFSLLGASAMVPAFTLAGFWALRHLDHLPPHTLGVSLTGRWQSHLGGGVIAGIGVIAIPVLVLWLAGAADLHVPSFHPRMAPVLLVYIAGALIFGAVEELIFRGYLFQTLLRGIGAPATLLFTAACFAGMHVTNPHLSPIALMNLFSAGVMFGMLYLRCGTLWLPIGLHAGWNLGQWLFGLPISGYTFPGVSPLDVSLHGPSWLTGGNFGLEGGAMASLIILTLVAVLTHMKRGLPLASRWWEWSVFQTQPLLPSTWDFSIDGSYYQWKLLARTPPES